MNTVQGALRGFAGDGPEGELMRLYADSGQVFQWAARGRHPRKGSYADAVEYARQSGGEYWEGYYFSAATGVLPIPTAWVVNHKGKVFDMTTDSPPERYYVGLPIPWKFALRVQIQTGFPGPAGVFYHLEKPIPPRQIIYQN